MPFRYGGPNSLKVQRLLGLTAIVLVGLGLGLAYLFLIPQGQTVGFPRTFDFVEHFSEARVSTPDPAYAEVQENFPAGAEQGLAIYAHPDTEIAFHDVPVYENAQLEFGVGLHQDVWPGPGDGVLFEVRVIDARGKEEVLFSRHLDPVHEEEDRGWQPVSLDLSHFADQQVTIILTTNKVTNPTYDWAAWYQPRLVSEEMVPVGREDHPNVVLISIDTLRADHLSGYGYERATSPNLDKLAQEGVLFEQAYCQAVITNPSHATILSSLYPHTHGVYDNADDRLPSEARTVAEILQENGYSTAAAVAVKFMLPEFSGLGQGFDTFFPFPEEAGIKAQRPAGEVNELVKSWLEEHYREKFFLFVHYYDPHVPYNPSEAYATRFYEGDPCDPTNHSLDEAPPYQRDRAGLGADVTDLAYPIALYDSEITYTDEQVGELLDFLDFLDLTDNTLVIVVSDHGESFGEHGIYFDHWTLYDDTLRVPLIMRYPGRLPLGQRIPSLVEAGVDIVPTILDLLNLPPLPEAEGRSLVPLLKGHQEPRTSIFGEQREAMAVAIRTERYKFILHRASSTSSIFGDNPMVEGKRELYDLQQDPGEHQNLLSGEGAPSDLSDQFTNLCQEWLEQKSVQIEPARGESSEELQEILDDLGY